MVNRKDRMGKKGGNLDWKLNQFVIGYTLKPCIVLTIRNYLVPNGNFVETEDLDQIFPKSSKMEI